MGGARTALFNYLFARKHKGQFILRIEDTDKARHQEDSLKPLLEALKWLRLDWDEGPSYHKENSTDFKGPLGPYRQSQRLAIYKKLSEQLIEEGKAYRCFLTETEIEAMKEKAKESGKPPKIFSPYRNLSKEEGVKKQLSGQPCAIRFKIPEEKKKNHHIQDLIRGSITFPQDVLEDFILIRSDGFPVYNFSCAVDDSLMKITHVFRGEEHLPNTLKQVLLQEAFGWTPPQYGHLSLILGEDKKKLSKREGGQNVQYFKEKGYLSEALINFLALLGWNPGTTQEHFSKEQLIEAFSIDRVNAAPAIFDKDKLSWLNSEHLKNLDPKDFWERFQPFYEKEELMMETDPLWRKKTFELLSPGFKTFGQALTLIKPLLKGGFHLEEEAKNILTKKESREVIKSWNSLLEKINSEYVTPEGFKTIQSNICSSQGIKGKSFFQPLRCVLMGKPEGIEIKTLLSLIKREELIQRSKKALALLF